MSKELSSVFATRLVERRQQIDAEAHVAGLDDHRGLGGLLDLGLVGGAQAGGADDVHLAGPWRRARQRRRVAAGTVKSMMPSALSSSGAGIAGQLDAVLGQARQHAGVPADQRRARVFQRARKRKALLSAIALTSVRPIRPPAPATTSRMSAIGPTPGTWRGYSAADAKSATYGCGPS